MVTDNQKSKQPWVCVPPMNLAPFSPVELRKALDEIRDFDVMAEIEFENKRIGVRASELIGQLGPYVCYGSTYGLSSEKQLTALDDKMIKYTVLHNQ
jgi:hypothetical protein